MDKTKTQLSFIHRFMPPKDGQSEKGARQQAIEGNKQCQSNLFIAADGSIYSNWFA